MASSSHPHSARAQPQHSIHSVFLCLFLAPSLSHASYLLSLFCMLPILLLLIIIMNFHVPYLHCFVRNSCSLISYRKKGEISISFRALQSEHTSANKTSCSLTKQFPAKFNSNWMQTTLISTEKPFPNLTVTRKLPGNKLIAFRKRKLLIYPSARASQGNIVWHVAWGLPIAHLFTEIL